MTKKKHSDEEFSIDLSKVKDWFTKLVSPKNKAWLIVLLILIPMFFSIFFRAYPYSLPVTDDWAYNSIYNNVKSQVTNEINTQYPNLPAENKNVMIEEQVALILSDQSLEVKTQAKTLSQSLKSAFQDDDNQTYMLAIDPYFYYRYTRNLLETGIYGDELVDGESYDNHMYAPIGRPMPTHFHPYLGLFWHKFMNLFGEKSLLQTFFMLPILLSALAVIPGFFIARKKAGLLGGFITAMIIALHSTFIGRTAGGFADTDAYNILFPLLIAWFFIEGFETSDIKKKGLFFSLSGLMVGLYSFAWSGWWYIFDFLVGAIGAYILFVIVRNIVQERKLSKLWSGQLKVSILSFVLFLVMSGVFVTLISGTAVFEQAATGPISFKVIKDAAKVNLWPNVYTTVAELNPASIASVIAQNGGKLLFFLACFGIALSLIRASKPSRNDWIVFGVSLIAYLALISNTLIRFNPLTYIIIFIIPIVLALVLLLKDKRDIDIKYALFLTIWFVGTIYASTKGVRFILLMVPAFAIAIGIAFSAITRLLSDAISNALDADKKLISGIIIVILCAFLFIPFQMVSGSSSYVSPMKAAHLTANGEIPSMNDAWWNTLDGIRTGSSEDAIITSWWDFGHWFKAIADRAVTFDGGSQNTPQAHWVGKLLMSDNEAETIGILRMLDCGAHTAFDEIDKKIQDTKDSIDLINQLILLEKNNANEFLSENGFSSEETNKILSLTHCDAPQALLITSSDMVGKSGVWAHFGSWNFDRAYIYNHVKNVDADEAVTILTSKFDFDEDRSLDYYYQVQSLSSDREVNDWIAPWPTYATSSWSACNNIGDETACNLRFTVGTSGEGYSLVISGAIINKTNPENSVFVLNFVNPSTGAIVGNQPVSPANVIFAGDTLEKYPVVESDFSLDMIYNNETNSILVSDPALSTSTFTKLFYFNGKYTEHFEQFSQKSSITGDRILVWKVNWN